MTQVQDVRFVPFTRDELDTLVELLHSERQTINNGLMVGHWPDHAEADHQRTICKGLALLEQRLTQAKETPPVGVDMNPHLVPDDVPLEHVDELEAL